ncbi:ITA7 protein, partial [Chloropsis cyanopogon]|nr:ITA7 protein [Chloropsis cyanopogon]
PKGSQGRGWHCHLRHEGAGGVPKGSQGQGWHCHLTPSARGCPRGLSGWHCHLTPRAGAVPAGSQGGRARRDEDGTAIFAVSDQKDVALEVQVTNEPSDPAEPQRDGDDAHQALLVATFPPELPYAALRAEEPAGGARSPARPQVRFFLILSTSGISIHTTELAVQLQLSTTSEQPGLEPVVARARVVIELPLAVTGVAVPPRLFFGGQVLGESAVKRESQVGSAVRFEVTV